MVSSLNVRWIHGSADCAANTDPAIQVHSFDQNTYIFRQSKCSNFEAPFLYLLFGEEKAILLDTGAAAEPRQPFPLREVVHEIISTRKRDYGRRPVHLVVAHTHSHGDHVFGDRQFLLDADTTVVPLTLLGVRDYFHLADWPDGQAEFDLGERRLTVIPSPGHEPTHVTFYDHATRILFTGDNLCPGYLYIRDWPAFRQTIARLARFAIDHPISYILGSHIEMTSTPGVAYPSGTTYQPQEHVLELFPSHLAELNSALDLLGDVPRRKVLDDFIIEPAGN